MSTCIKIFENYLSKFIQTIKSSIAYKTLLRIGTIYDLENALKDLSPAERLKERQASIRPLVEEYFAWVKETLNSNTLALTPL